MAFNRDVMRRTPEQHAEKFRDSMNSGFYFNGADEDPYRAMVYHEYGHVLDNRGGWDARATMSKDMISLYSKSPAAAELLKEYGDNPPPEKLMASLSDWLQNRTKQLGLVKLPEPRVSGYSMKDYAIPGNISPITNKVAGVVPDAAEAIAQAFDDVERRGELASDLSKLLHDRVIEEAQKAVPTGIDYDKLSALKQDSATEKFGRVRDTMPNVDDALQAVKQAAAAAVIQAQG
jgi:hypothetical protein